MTTVSILLQQIKEKDERDLAYTKKIKEAETLLKAEQDALKKLTFRQQRLSEEINRRRLRCSEKEITKVMLQHQAHIWESLFKEAQTDLKEKETKLEESQQCVCLDRLAFYDDVKAFIDKQELINIPSSNHDKLPSPVAVGRIIKIEQDEDENKKLMEKIVILENQLEELNDEVVQIEEAKNIKTQLEAEPSCGTEFLRIQKLLKETKDSLENAEEEVANLKKEISEKELIILQRRSSATEGKQIGSSQFKLNEVKPTIVQGTTSASKTVTFNSAVELKNISPPPPSKVIIKAYERTKSPSAALKRKLSQQLTSQLEKTMRDIIFKDKL